MPYDHNITDILEINRKSYKYDSINKEDIMNRLKLLTADNMEAIFHSKNHKKLKDQNPKEWTTDHFYSKSFSVEVLSNQTIQSLNQVQKESMVKLGYPPKNNFMPSNISPMKSMTTHYMTPA